MGKQARAIGQDRMTAKSGMRSGIGGRRIGRIEIVTNEELMKNVSLKRVEEARNTLARISMETKSTNPKEALGTAKVSFHVLPCRVLGEFGLGMMEGGRKYGTHNYREMGVRMSTYYNAALRHLMAWWEGEDLDPDSGVHHIIKAGTCLIVLRDSMHMGNAVDDRPIQLPDKLDLPALNEQAAGIIEKYPDCKEPFTQLG